MWLYVRRILHWGPLLALSVIAVITTATILCDIQWWPPNTWGGFLNMTVFAMWNVLTLYNFFCAAFNGPGHVPFEWKPKRKDSIKHLQFCSFCDGYKAPRSHHCRKCQRCVMKMDHHCPWINNCVGHSNHGSFTSFLFWAPCGCIHALFILIPAMYRAINRNDYIEEGRTDVPLVSMTVNTFLFGMFGISFSFGVAIAVWVLFYIQNYYLYFGTGQEPLVHIGVRGFVACMFSVGLAIGVIFAVGGLFYVQMRSILKNETGIETWIKDKADYREKEEGEEDFVFPYNLGRWENFKMIFHWTSRPELDGIWWPVIEGCNQYTLTIEQIKQKKEKKERSMQYEIRYAFSGSMCPITWGPRVCCCPPCTDEPRIKLSPGDIVRVSRWKKRWLYGDKILDAGSSVELKRVRGWFPRKCAIEPYQDESGSLNSSTEQESQKDVSNSMDGSGDSQAVNSSDKKTN